MKDLQGKLALITGGSRGLGKNMAQHLAAAGSNVIITYHSNEAAAIAVVQELTSSGVKAKALQLDVSRTADFGAFAERLSGAMKELGHDKLDALVNNGGMGVHAMLAETTEEQFDMLMNTHFKGVLFLSQKLLGHIKDGGAIVNISSGLARFSLPGYGAYAAMKGAIETLSRYMARELGDRRIRVNVVAPGAIETDFGGGAVRDNADINAFVASMTALGRAGKPDDIGPIVAFLCSDAAGWINGQRIEASGGMTL